MSRWEKRRRLAAVSSIPHVVTDPQLVKRVQAANGPIKRSVDLFGALLLLILAAPIMAAVAVALMLESRGPILARETRVGRRGRPFVCLKFRSHRRNADEVLQQFLERYPTAAQEWDETGELHDDPRVTRLGGVLRRSCLDELPQLFNVLRGEMSLVGPRPVPKPELSHYGADRRYYLLVRPGLTGLWQISRRFSGKPRVNFDRAYLENWTMAQDLSILICTVPALLQNTAR